MIYLDNAATSWPKAPGVADAVAKALSDPLGNVGRSAHAPALASSQILFECRKGLQSIMPPTALEKTVFTMNATEALNVAISGSIAGKKIRVLTTRMEHNAVARVLHHHATCSDLEYEFIRCDDFGRVDIEDFHKRLLDAKYDLVVFTAASNVSGAINPVREMVMLCAEAGVPFVIDGAQVMGELMFEPFVESARGALCFSLHKGLLGPTGVGVMALYGDFAPRPLVHGGTGSRSDSEVQPDFLPDRYESGTPPIHALAGVSVAVEYVVSHFDDLARTRNRCDDVLYHGLSAIDGLRMLCDGKDRTSVVSVTVNEGTIGELSRHLYAMDVAVRAGFHCAPWAHRHLGTTNRGGAIRFSISPFNTEQEMEDVIRIVKEVLHG